MKSIVWEERFALGLGEIDQHHRYLIGLLAKLHEEFVKGEPDLQRTLGDLASYAEYHFKSEELWMVQGFYPETEAHMREHRFFIEKLSEFKEHSGTSQYRSLKAIVFLEEWITQHILTTDASLGAYLSQGWDQMKDNMILGR